MGSETSRGIGVLNLSSFHLNIGTSMAATHYFENGVKHGQIFYRSPGAVWCTVFAQVGPQITLGTCAKELTQAVGLGLFSTASAVGTILTAGGLVPFLAIEGGTVTALAAAAGVGTTSGTALKGIAEVASLIENPRDLYVDEKGCYAGLDGCWLIIEGGIEDSSGHPFNRLTMRKSTQEEVMSRGRFTSESYDHYHTKSGLPSCYGHTCTSACPLLFPRS